MTDRPFEERRNRRQPETLRLRAVVPALDVSDLQRSVSWYRDVMGFTVMSWEPLDGDPTSVVLVAGSERVVLIQDEDALGERTKGQGVRLHFKTAQDVDSLAAGLKARGGTLTSGPEQSPSGGRAFSLEDPDGYRITISSVD